MVEEGNAKQLSANVRRARKIRTQRALGIFAGCLNTDLSSLQIDELMFVAQYHLYFHQSGLSKSAALRDYLSKGAKVQQHGICLYLAIFIFGAMAPEVLHETIKSLWTLQIQVRTGLPKDLNMLAWLESILCHARENLRIITRAQSKPASISAYGLAGDWCSPYIFERMICGRDGRRAPSRKLVDGLTLPTSYLIWLCGEQH